jgi:hypothetical protein
MRLPYPTDMHSTWAIAVIRRANEDAVNSILVINTFYHTASSKEYLGELMSVLRGTERSSCQLPVDLDIN